MACTGCAATDQAAIEVEGDAHVGVFARYPWRSYDIGGEVTAADIIPDDYALAGVSPRFTC